MKKCPACVGGEPIEDYHGLRITVVENHMNISYDAYSTDSSFVEEIPIKFCPICGTNLQTK